MLKLKFYSRIGLFVFGLLINNYNVVAQCTNTAAFASATAPTTVTTQQISGCSYQSEYSTINGVQAVTLYSCNYLLSGVSNGYITIHQGTFNGPVVGSGPAPLTWTSTIAGTYYAHWNVDASCLTLTSCGVSSITYIGPASACTNPIIAGSTVSTPANACPSQNINLSLNGATLASGISYQWQSSTDGVSFTDIAGATNSSYSTTQSTTVFYQCVLICSAGSTSTSTPVQVDMNAYYDCYCTPAPTSTDGSGITNVTYGTVNNTTVGEPGGYADYSSFSSDYSQNDLVTISISFNTLTYDYDTRIWVDWNNNGSFEVAEEMYWGFSGTMSPNTLIATFTVPVNAPAGPHRMRIGGCDIATPIPCYTGSWGSYEDYSLNILANCNPISIVNPGSQSVCSSYNLPTIAEVTPSGNADLTMNYYDGPGGTGNVVVGPITSTQTIYAYGSSSGGACFDDQVFTITVNLPNTGIDTQVACGAYTWINGVTYTANNNTATYTLTNVLGCDSIVTLNLTFTSSNTGIDIQNSCLTYTWINGVTYTANNNSATYTLTNIYGCDSIVTLNLTINSPNTGIDIQSACVTYTWINGQTYTTNNNTATFTLQNIYGCDSIVTLNLTIFSPNTGVDVQSSCGPYTWINGVTYSTNNNTATYTLTNIFGCDSIVTLNLTIASAAITANGNTTFCQNQNVVLQSSSTTGNLWSNGATSPTITVTTAGSYSVTITNALGCVTTSNTINVVVNPLPNVSAGPDQTFCAGTITSLSGAGAQTYTWNNGITNNQTFIPNTNLNCIVTGTDANGCTATDAMFITVNQPTYYTIIGSAITSFTLNGQTYNQTGVYTQTFQNALGCDSIITLDLSMNYLGLSESEQVSFSVFPNPTNDILNIQFLGDVTSTSFEIIDLQGRKVTEGAVNSTNTKIDLTEIQAGNYFLKLGISNRKIQFMKL